VGNSGGVLMFDYSQPCRPSESVDIPINTALVTDGQHTLKVTVEDAAQNSSVVYDGTITTKNAPAASSPPTILAPSQVFTEATLSTHPGTWEVPADTGTLTYGYQWESCGTEGNNCQAIAGAQNSTYTPTPVDVGHTLRLIVNASDNDGLRADTSAATSVVLSSQGTLGAPNGPGTRPGSAGGGNTSVGQGTPNGTGASETAIIRLGIRHTITRSFSRRAFKLAGRLLDNQGYPIGSASLDILQQTIDGGSLRLIAHAKTRADGSFLVALGAAPSRLIEVAYRAFSADTNYTTMSEIKESVAAGVQLTIAPRQTSPNGTIVLTGQVLGQVPRQGTIVDLLVHYRGQWEPFRTPRTDASGLFQVVYQFEGGIGRFPFRAAVPAGQAGFPFSSGYSKVVDVTAG
jgi:Ig domain of plant-specific actin-binding protein